MRHVFTVFLSIAALAGFAAAAEKKVQMKDLPPAVQKTVQEQTKGVEIKGISQETEKGRKLYEVETTANGMTRDFIVDTKGAVVEVEQEVSIDSIPAAAKAAIETTAAGGKITKVETLTKAGKTTYEAAYTKGGKSHETTVSAEGSAVK